MLIPPLLASVCLGCFGTKSLITPIAVVIIASVLAHTIHPCGYYEGQEGKSEERKDCYLDYQSSPLPSCQSQPISMMRMSRSRKVISSALLNLIPMVTSSPFPTLDRFIFCWRLVLKMHIDRICNISRLDHHHPAAPCASALHRAFSQCALECRRVGYFSSAEWTFHSLTSILHPQFGQ